MSVIPAVLLNAVREYTPLLALWRMSDGKDLVRVELTFHKNQPTTRLYKKGAKSMRQPVPSAGKWPRQPTPARLPTSRQTPAHRPTPHLEREMPPPPMQTLHQPETITLPRYKTTMTITASPTTCIYRPAPTSFPDALPKKKPRTKSPSTTAKIPTQYFSIDIESEFLLHEKYDLQDVYSVKYKAIIKANRLQRDDEDHNVDLPAFFVYHRDNQHWALVKEPTSKYHNEHWYSYIEMLAERGTKQKNTVFCYNVLEKSCSDPLRAGGGPPLLHLVLPSYLGMAYTK